MQQATEKALKALFIERSGTLAPRTHDLDYLGNLVTVPPGIASDLAALNPTFDHTRYPDSTSGRAPVDAVSEADATAHHDASERVMTWVKGFL